MNTIKLKTDYHRVRELAGQKYAQIYQVIKGVNVITSNLEYKKEFWMDEEIMILEVIHDKGKFSFPIQNCIKAGLIDIMEHEDELQNIFFNLLSMPTSNKQIA